MVGRMNEFTPTPPATTHTKAMKYTTAICLGGTVAVVGFTAALSFFPGHHVTTATPSATEPDIAMVRTLAVQEMHEDVKRLQASSGTLDMGMMAREMECSDAIMGVKPADSHTQKVAEALAGPMTPDQQIRVNICASNYMKKAKDMVNQSSDFARR